MTLLIFWTKIWDSNGDALQAINILGKSPRTLLLLRDKENFFSSLKVNTLRWSYTKLKWFELKSTQNKISENNDDAFQPNIFRQTYKF